MKLTMLKSLAILALCLPIASHAANLKLINHFDKTMSFKITINPATLPDFPVNFTLPVNGQIETKVLDVDEEAYIHGVELGNSGHTTFFGAEVVNGKTMVHGYYAKGIAFSWKTDTITFCTPEEYQKKNSCE